MQDALLSIFIRNVVAPIGLYTVIFVPLVTNLPPGEAINLLAARTQPRVLHQGLPTPINNDHLQFFHSGYTPSIVECLSEGFSFGFPLHFEGPQGSCHAKNLHSALENPEAVDANFMRKLQPIRKQVLSCLPPFLCFIYHPWVWYQKRRTVNSV